MFYTVIGTQWGDEGKGKIVDWLSEQADVVVVNSCVVRKSAEDKVTGMLAKLNGFKKNNPSQVIALMGCMVGPKQDKLQKQFPVFLVCSHFQYQVLQLD